MNMRTDFAVVLRIESPGDSAALGDDLLAVLVSYPVSAIHELDVEHGTCWDVSFGERAWSVEEVLNDKEHALWWLNPTSVPLEAHWRRYPDLEELVTKVAGRHLVSALGPDRVTCKLLAEPTWNLNRLYESYKRVRVGRIVVAPPWDLPDVDGTTIVIGLKPSMGFGTGHHPSTRLALSLLQQVACEGRDVLDIGTGSGVLAMAAAKLGAARVCAIDRDPNAITAADENLRRNWLAKRVELRHADIATDVIGEFDLVIANLEAAQIEAWTPALLRHVRRDGQLLLSGFLEAEGHLVARTLPLPVSLVEFEDGWAAAVLEVLTSENLSI
jgi:ribosomal protein L11 methyltransferase